jgi:phage terminase large subunit
MTDQIDVEIEIDFDSVFLPVYKPLQSCKEHLRFLYGGRDSGKSRDIAQRKIIKCLTSKYFRCILIKKTKNSIKDSQWQLIKDICEEWGIDHLFDFHTSPLEIICANGNKFICRGMDDPAKIKSISNPSDAWVEEGNQLSMEDWIYIITTLRTNDGEVEIEMSFNTETKTDFKEFWLYKEYFAHTTDKSFRHYKEIKLGNEMIRLEYIAIHSTYHDNPYVSKLRRAYHENLASLNFYWYKVFTLGEWGNEDNDSPWLFAYNRQKHVSAVELFARRSETLYLSFDFNRNPQVCTVIQHYEDTVWIIEVIKIPNVGTEGICEQVLVRYPGFLYVITGDYSGETVSSLYKEQVTNYTIIKRILSLSNGQIKTTVNPRLEKNQTLVNTIFHNYNIQMCPVKAKPAIFDAENVKKRADGTIVKDNRDDPAQQADVLDTLRYWFNKFMTDFIKQMEQKWSAAGKVQETKPAVIIPREQVSVKERSVILALNGSKPIKCSREEYLTDPVTVRMIILEEAGRSLENKDPQRAVRCMTEIKRLDQLFKAKKM